MIVKSPGHDIQYKHKKTLKDGEVVEWLGVSEPGEQHRGELPSFVFNLIYPGLSAGENNNPEMAMDTDKNKNPREACFHQPKEKMGGGEEPSKMKTF